MGRKSSFVGRKIREGYKCLYGVGWRLMTWQWLLRRRYGGGGKVERNCQGGSSGWDWVVCGLVSLG